MNESILSYLSKKIEIKTKTEIFYSNLWNKKYNKKNRIKYFLEQMASYNVIKFDFLR